MPLAVVIQSCLDSVTPRTAARQASLSFTIFWSLLKLISTESVMPFNCLIFCRSILCFQCFPALVFSSESALCIRWPKYWSFSFSIRPSNEYSGLISFRMDWFDLLAVQGTLKSLLQHQSSKASIHQHSAFFIIQLSSIALTIETFINKVMSPVFNILFRFVIALLPKSKCILIL